MSEQDLFRAMSDLDEDLIMKPRKYVSLRMNVLFCFLAANISHFVPHRMPKTGIFVYFLSFAVLYGAATWWMNRKKNRKLFVEDDQA